MLIAWYAGDAKLVGVFVGALAGLWACSSLLARLALLGGRGVQKMSHGPLRFGLAQLLRHRFDSTLQLGAFTLALFLVALLALVRSDLIASWRAAAAAGCAQLLSGEHRAVSAGSRRQLSVAASAPGLRRSIPWCAAAWPAKTARPSPATLPPEARDNATLRRELNLTWTATLPANNIVLAGRWHGQRRAAAPVKGTPAGAPLLRSDPSAEISVESGMAEQLNLAVGDTLGFQVGDQTIAARITSIRSVKWDSMQPNFFVIFAPGQLDALPASSIASVHVPAGKASVLPRFVKAFPGITVLALDKAHRQYRSRVRADHRRDSTAAGISARCRHGRRHRHATRQPRRAPAGSRPAAHPGRPARLSGQKRCGASFIALGSLAGLLASACAEIAMAMIAHRLFELPVRLHPWLWLALPTGRRTAGRHQRLAHHAAHHPGAADAVDPGAELNLIARGRLRPTRCGQDDAGDSRSFFREASP